VANIKSQIKRNRQNEKRRLRNKSVKSSLKTAVRKFNEATEAGDRDKGVIHENQAANRKSAIAKRLQSLSA
jgi:small subunit ribosomal protein S20